MGRRQSGLEPVQAWNRFSRGNDVFGDVHEVAIPDPMHSESELRFVSIGRSERGFLLVVAYTERGRRIRIISARQAGPRERRQYESRD